MKNPIDEKVDRATEIITTSKTILKLANILLLIGTLTGTGFTFFCIAALLSVRQDQLAEVLTYLIISVFATTTVIVLYSRNNRKLKQLINKQ